MKDAHPSLKILKKNELPRPFSHALLFGRKIIIKPWERRYIVYIALVFSFCNESQKNRWSQGWSHQAYDNIL